MTSNALVVGLLELVLAAAKSEVEKAPEDIARDVIDLINTVTPTAFADYLTTKDAKTTDEAVDIAEEAKLAVKAMGG